VQVIPETSRPDAHVKLNVKRLAVEEVLPGEDQAINGMIANLQKQLKARYPGTATVRRDAHPKHFGLVNASFTVDLACPREMRHGIFQVPGRRFDAQIRLSNGDPNAAHDLKPDVRGLAIKVSTGTPSLLAEAGVELPEDAGHDMVMATGEAFFGRNAVDFAKFPGVSASTAKPSDLKTLQYFLKPARWWGGLQLLGSMLQFPASPLALKFFSQTPYRLGPHCVKYHVRPARRRRSTGDPWYMRPVSRHLFFLVVPLLTLWAKWSRRDPSSVLGFNALRDSLIRDLERGPVTLELLIQRWPDLSRLPVWAIENATRKWTAPWVKAATIVVHQQNDIPTRDAKAERMSLTPWRVPEVHQPLGSINRARLHVYLEMAAFRRALNEERAQPRSMSAVSAR